LVKWGAAFFGLYLDERAINVSECAIMANVSAIIKAERAIIELNLQNNFSSDLFLMKPSGFTSKLGEFHTWKYLDCRSDT
jgi:hypothetical protein